jgi:chitin elicitor receptor kinase 1
MVGDILSYNTDTIQNIEFVRKSTKVNVPFPCDCSNDEFPGHTFLYELQPRDTYASISEERIQRDNVYGTLNVTVNCSCENGEVSKD